MRSRTLFSGTTLLIVACLALASALAVFAAGLF
jgi:hypothetical protein